MKVWTVNPLLDFIGHQSTIILDGGLATTLEDRGFDLDDDLWSARVLLERPEAIGQVHRDFLAAGADCLTTATYQASLPGLARRGLDPQQARGQLDLAVDLAVSSRDEFWSRSVNRRGRLLPLVAASVGPYGAYLADGSEYTGAYRVPEQDLVDFHRERWAILADSKADLLACETLPSLPETEVLLDLLAESPHCWAWFSFSCRDGTSLCDGSPFAEAVALCSQAPQVAAIGINCTGPEFITPLLEIGRRATGKPLLAYPNSGERYDPHLKSWVPTPDLPPLTSLAQEWIANGAAAVGGCCRVGPDRIAELRRLLLD